MRERSELILKIVCGVLAALLLVQLVRLVIHTGPLRGVRIPELPTLPASPDQTAAKGTNIVTGKASVTNVTNVVTNQMSGEKGTNSGATQTVVTGQVLSTNATNTVTSQKSEEKGTNSTTAQASAKTETNSPANPAGPLETNSAPTRSSKTTETNSPSGQASDKTQTNAALKLAAEKTGTNAVATNAVAARTPGKTGPPPSMSPPGMTKLPELPPLIQARIDKIAQSEILAPFMRRMPMALLGIAGQDAFLRAPSGQTGLVKEGGELGGIKLLQIGINRVLVEQEGEKKELTIFSGLGSESLLPKPKPATNEIITKPK